MKTKKACISCKPHVILSDICTKFRSYESMMMSVNNMSIYRKHSFQFHRNDRKKLLNYQVNIRLNYCLGRNIFDCKIFRRVFKAFKNIIIQSQHLVIKM